MDCRNVLRVMCCLTISLCPPVFADSPNNKTNFHIEGLYLQPNSNNLKYAVFVSGNQPYQQSWHNKSINPGYSPAFELGFDYAIHESSYNVSIDWLHANTSDSGSAQASQNTDVATVQFVAPPYDVGPAVFGIKRADSNVKSNLNNVNLDVGKVFEYGAELKGRVFTGISILNISQKLTTTFSDYAGSPEIPGQAYALPADPDFYFTSKNTSDYNGVGPNVGVYLQYENSYGFGVAAQFTGALTVGSISAKDKFTSASHRLIALGMNPSQQEITTPNTIQFVPSFDGKIGVLYDHAWSTISTTIEAGYRFTYYINAISTISPDTLVQAGDDPAIPEFSTGTMAINSTTSTNGPFSLSGPYLNLMVNFLC